MHCSKALFKKACPSIIPLQERFGAEIDRAVVNNSVPMMKKCYEDYLKLPKSSTIKRIHERGIVLGAPIHGHEDTILYNAFLSIRPLVLKKLVSSEKVGYLSALG